MLVNSVRKIKISSKMFQSRTKCKKKIPNNSLQIYVRYNKMSAPNFFFKKLFIRNAS